MNIDTTQSTVPESTLSNMGNSDLKRVQTKSSISSLLPGSWAPNWLHGNARIAKPASTPPVYHTKGKKSKGTTGKYNFSELSNCLYEIYDEEKISLLHTNSGILFCHMKLASLICGKKSIYINKKMKMKEAADKLVPKREQY